MFVLGEPFHLSQFFPIRLPQDKKLQFQIKIHAGVSVSTLFSLSLMFEANKLVSLPLASLLILALYLIVRLQLKNVNL